jgi:hypothetical protein
MNFGKAFADCRVRKLSDTRFKRRDERYLFETSWQGIPTRRGSLTYYALSLPEFAIPKLVEVGDPHFVGKQYRKTIYRDDQR